MCTLAKIAQKGVKTNEFPPEKIKPPKIWLSTRFFVRFCMEGFPRQDAAKDRWIPSLKKSYYLNGDSEMEQTMFRDESL